MPTLPGPPSQLCSLEAGMVNGEPGKERNKANSQRSPELEELGLFGLAEHSWATPSSSADRLQPPPHVCVHAHVHRYSYTQLHTGIQSDMHTHICILTPMQTHTTHTRTHTHKARKLQAQMLEWRVSSSSAPHSSL